MSKILINTSNLHVGGGVQVATSFLYELSKKSDLNFTPTVYLSSEVSQELDKLGVDIKQKNWIIYNTYGINNYFKHKKEFSKFDIIFTVFGPNYFISKNQKTITGFAQPWIIYPDNETYRKLPFIQKIKSRCKFLLQKTFFKQSDILIVELDHVKKQLVDLKINTQQNIVIVRNCFSSIYLDQSQWQPLVIKKNTANIRLGFVGRDYPHKNLSIIPNIKKILLSKYNIAADFFVTLNESEWEARDPVFKKNIVNVGSLAMTECPSFYKEMDAIIFPSLLECFSATPLESMVMGTPVFASDRNFIRDACNQHVSYFDPLNPESAAEAISNYFKLSIEDRNQRLNEAKQYALNFSNAEERARKYISIIQNSLN